MSVEVKPAGQSETHNWLIYADPGAGKTSFIGSGGKQFKILLVRPPVVHVDPIIGSGVQEAVVHDWEDMTEVQEMLAHVKKGEWDWVWLDDISSWQDVGLEDVYQAALDRAGPHGSAARAHREQFRADKGEFRTNAERISSLIRDLVGSDAFNFGVTAHPFWGPRLVTDDEAQTSIESEQLQPWIQVKGMVSKVCGYMNLVGYMEVAENKRGVEYRRLLTNKGPRHYAKCQYIDAKRKNVFGENGIIVNPTLPEMVQVAQSTRRPPRRTRQRPAVRRRTRA